MRADSTGDSVVIPAVFAPSATTCLRSLGRRDIHTIAAYETNTPPAFYSRYCDETVLTPPPSTDLVGYKDALVTLVSRDDVRTVIPMREADTYVLAKYRTEFQRHVRPIWPRFETLQIAHDRLRLTRTADEAGVPVPETGLLDEIDDWSRDQVVKARYALLTDDYVASQPPAQFIEPDSVYYLRGGIKPNRDEIRTEMDHTPIVQEYIPGPEYALWALYMEGEPVALSQKRQIRAFSYTGGTSVYRETVRIPELEAVGRALLDHLEWDGFASVQFKRDTRTGEFKLMEINPRTWVSLSCPVRAGIDYPYYYWRLAGSESVDPTSEYRTKVATHRLGGEMMYLRSILTDESPFVEPPPIGEAIREIATSFYTQPHYDYLTADDPLPFVRDGINWLARRLEGVRFPSL